MNIILLGAKFILPILQCTEPLYYASYENERHKLDLKESLAILSTLNNEISSYSVRDCFRLGKFKKQSTRPRPIMVKLNRVIDVTTILANRNLTPKGISIKPDLNQEDRQCESLLLGERWRLIQSGVDRKLIKIKSSAIYVQGRKHGQVLNNSFQYTNLHNQQNNPNTAQTLKTMTQHPFQQQHSLLTIDYFINIILLNAFYGMPEVLLNN